MVVIKDHTQRELIEDAVCAICLGIVRLPGKMCNNCSKLFCVICVKKISGFGYDIMLEQQNNQNESCHEI